MATISKIGTQATKINFSSNVLYYFAFGTIVVSGDVMQIKFLNGLEQRFDFSDFTTSEPSMEAFIDSLIVLDYFRVPTTGGGGGGGGTATSTDTNQVLQITQETLTNTKLDSLIAAAATDAVNQDSMILNQYTSENTLDKILKELKIHTKLLRKILS